MLTFSDLFEKLGNAIALGELARVADSASTDKPEQHSECINVDAAVVLSSDEFGSHVQRSSNDTAGHHRRRLAETKVGEFAAIFKVQL